MQPKPDIKLGTIVQINPDLCEIYGGQFCIVTEVLDFGIQGYLALVPEYKGLTRYNGVAYLRLAWEKIEVVGFVEWHFHTSSSEAIAELGDQNDNQNDYQSDRSK
jgi:hypothetical protein